MRKLAASLCADGAISTLYSEARKLLKKKMIGRLDCAQGGLAAIKSLPANDPRGLAITKLITITLGTVLDDAEAMYGNDPSRILAALERHDP